MNTTEKNSYKELENEALSIKSETIRLRGIINKINTNESLKLFRFPTGKEGNKEDFVYLIELNRATKIAKIYYTRDTSKDPRIVSLSELGFVNEELIDLVFVLIGKNYDIVREYVKLVISNREILKISKGNVLDAINLIQDKQLYSSILGNADERYIVYIDRHVKLYKSNIETLKRLYDIYLENIATLNYQYQICDEMYALSQRSSKFRNLIKSN